MSTCHYLTGQDTHLAAYKRPITVQSVNGAKKKNATSHKQISHSLSWQLGSKQKIHQEQFTNPKFPKSQFKQFQWSFYGFSEIQDWIIIIESSLCNASTEFVTLSNKSCAITDSRNWEEEGEEFEGSGPVKKKKREIQRFSSVRTRRRKEGVKLLYQWKFEAKDQRNGIKPSNRTQVTSQLRLLSLKTSAWSRTMWICVRFELSDPKP